MNPQCNYSSNVAKKGKCYNILEKIKKEEVIRTKKSLRVVKHEKNGLLID